MDINRRIRRLIAYYVRLCGTNDPEKIASFLKIHIAIMPLGDALGYYRYIKRIKWSFINEDFIDDKVLAKVVIAHELGHALLHTRENCTFMNHHTLLLTSKIECQANLFAARLLITDDMLQDYAGYTREQFCECTGYPPELLDLRLK